MNMKIGIIGGTGLGNLGFSGKKEDIKMMTPYGIISDSITKGDYKGREIYVLPRHGRKHDINPSNVNYRANIWALKQLGVTHILAPTAVGSLREDYKPRDIVFTDQFIDFTKQRKSSFYDGSTEEYNN